MIGFWVGLIWGLWIARSYQKALSEAMELLREYKEFTESATENLRESVAQTDRALNAGENLADKMGLE